MVSGSLALLYFLLGFHGGRQGSSPNRGQSPVEWRDFLFVRWYVRPPLWAIQPGLRPSQPGLRPRQPASQVSGYRTLSPIGAAAQKARGGGEEKKEQERSGLEGKKGKREEKRKK